MLFADTVVGDRLVHKTRAIVIMLVVATAILTFFGMNDTIFGEFLRPVIGEPKESGFFGNFSVGLVLAILFTINVILVGFLSFKFQVLVVWLELLLLFMAFF